MFRRSRGLSRGLPRGWLREALTASLPGRSVWRGPAAAYSRRRARDEASDGGTAVTGAVDEAGAVVDAVDAVAASFAGRRRVALRIAAKIAAKRSDCREESSFRR